MIYTKMFKGNSVIYLNSCILWICWAKEKRGPSVLHYTYLEQNEGSFREQFHHKNQTAH